MRISSTPLRSFATASLLAALAGTMLSGCATPIAPVEVTRFHRLDTAPARLTGRYAIVPADADASSGTPTGAQTGLAWQTYAAAVSRQLDLVGAVAERPGDSARTDYLVTLDVERSERRAGERRSPVSVGVGGGVGGGGGYSGGGVGLGIGINLGGGNRGEVETRLSVRILRRSDNQAVWEGRAVTVAGARTPAAQPGIAADKLAAALFRDFPGRSGETISVE